MFKNAKELEDELLAKVSDIARWHLGSVPDTPEAKAEALNDVFRAVYRLVAKYELLYGVDVIKTLDSVLDQD